MMLKDSVINLSIDKTYYISNISTECCWIGNHEPFVRLRDTKSTHPVLSKDSKPAIKGINKASISGDKG